MHDDCGNLFLRHAVCLGIFKVELQRRVRDAGSHQSNNRDNASRLDVDILIVPVFAEKNVVIIMGKFRANLPSAFLPAV